MYKSKQLLPLFHVITFWLLSCCTALLAAGVEPEHITLTWSDDPRTTQTITWKTPAVIVGSQVQYAEAAQGFPAQAVSMAASVAALPTNSGEVAVHSAVLNGLRPNTRYVYRVGGPENWSQPRYFTTAPGIAQPFTFLVFGDSQSVNYQVWGTTLHQAYQRQPQAAFFVNVGDLVDRGQDYAHWQGWFNAAQGVVDTIPVMPVTGNHEMYTAGPHRFSQPVLFTAQLKLPQNGPEQLKGQAYSFDYADVHIVMLDSQAGEQREFVPDLLERQAAWLEKDLQNTRQKWKFAVLHRPLYNNRPGEGESAVRRVFGPIFDKYHVDIVFSGHDHAYARTYPLHDGAIAASPAQGTVYVACGRSGTKAYQDVQAKEYHEFFYDPLQEPNYLTVEVSQAAVQVRAFTQSGSLIDQWRITK